MQVPNFCWMWDISCMNDESHRRSSIKCIWCRTWLFHFLSSMKSDSLADYPCNEIHVITLMLSLICWKCNDMSVASTISITNVRNSYKIMYKYTSYAKSIQYSLYCIGHKTNGTLNSSEDKPSKISISGFCKSLKATERWWFSKTLRSL